MLHRGAKPGALYKGVYKPGKLYKGTQLVAGYADVSKAAPASWDGTYDDVVGVAAQGRGKQQTYSGAQLLDISTCTINSGKPYGLTITCDGDVVKIQGTADLTSDWVSFALIYAPNYDLSGKGYVVTPFVIQGSIINVYGLRNAEERAIAVSMGLSEGEAVDVALRLMVSVDTPTAYEPYVGGQPSPSPDYPQPLVAAEGALTASGRTGTTPTTVTLPVLRSMPGSDIRDTLAYVGGGQWKVNRRVGVIDSYSGESVSGAWASSTGQLTTGAVVWYTLATPATETVTLGELPSYPVHTELAVSGDYPPDVVGTIKVGT